MASDQREPQKAESMDHYDGILDRAVEAISGVEQRIRGERLSASELTGGLVEQPRERSQMLIANSQRYHQVGVVEELLASTVARWSDDPRAAEEIASLALEVLEHTDPEVYGEALLNDLRAQAWAYIANTRRIRGDVNAVAGLFALAESHLLQGTGDAFEQARLLDLRASFARDRRQWQDAANLLDEVTAIYRAVGDHHLVGRTLVSRSTMIHESNGEPAESIALMREAAKLIEPHRDLHLHLGLYMNLAIYLTEADQAEEAYTLLPEMARLAEELGHRVPLLRSYWTAGLVYQALDRDEEAHAAFERARAGFLDEQLPLQASLVSLDLAAHCLEQGEFDEARALARDTIGVFGSIDVPAEVLTALALVREATEKEITVSIVRDTMSRLRQGRTSVDDTLYN